MLILPVLMAFGGLSGAASAQVPTCTIQSTGGVPTTDFRPGDELVLSGTGFPADVLVLVTFRQPPRTVELGRFRTNVVGEFTSQPTPLRIPADAAGGPAAIHAASSDGSGTCDLRVVGSSSVAGQGGAESPATSDEDDDSDFGPWLVVWAILLAIGASYLVYLRYRRWEQGRLERQISELGTDPHRGRVFKTDVPTLPHRRSRRKRGGKRNVLHLGDQQRSASPPVLREGWDAEAAPTRQPPPEPD